MTRSRHWLWPLKNTKPLHFFFFCTFIGDLFTKRRKRKISTEGHKFPFFFSFPTAVYFGYIDFPSRYVRWFRLACANFWRDPNEMIRFLSRPHTHTCPCSWEIDNNKRTTFKHHVFFFALGCRHASRLSHVCSGGWPEYNISPAFLVFFRKDNKIPENFKNVGPINLFFYFLPHDLKKKPRRRIPIVM